MVEPIRSCVTFQFANLGEKNKECYSECLGDTDPNLMYIPCWRIIQCEKVWLIKNLVFFLH